MGPLDALEVSKLPLWPEWQHFDELEVETSTYANSNEQSELLQITQTDEARCTIVEECTNVDTNIS